MSTLIPVLAHKLPEFVREDYPNFVQYVRDYLAWMEQDDNFLGIINAWKENMEPSRQVEPYIDAMLTDLGFVSGQNLAVDKNLLIHLLQDFYLSRGTEASFRFLFRMLFNADVEIRYPREQMLVPSFAEYGERHFIFTTANNINMLDFQDLVLYVRENGGTLTGLTTKVKASIENIQIVHGSGTPYFRIEILRPTFEFLVGEAVTIISGDYAITEFVKPVLAIEMNTPGSGYKAGEVIQITGAKLNGNAFIESTRKGGVSNIQIVSSGANYSVGDLIVARSDDDGFGFSASVTQVDAQGGITGYKVINEGYNYATLPNLYAQSTVPASLKASGGNVGAIQTVKMENPFVDFDTTDISIVSAEGTGGTLTAKAVSRWETREWTDRKGFLAESSTLIDSDRVQQFSYTIVSPISSSLYDSFVADYLHPVGFVRSSSYEIVSNLGLNITSGTPAIGTETPIVYPAVLNLTFVSEYDSFETITLVTDTGDEFGTNLFEPILID
ncbi:baseplate wedge protein [Xanthomonas phage X1]|nr:baseplate wedge protein [Xanthomonas phage X1]